MDMGIERTLMNFVAAGEWDEVMYDGRLCVPRQ